MAGIASIGQSAQDKTVEPVLRSSGSVSSSDGSRRRMRWQRISSGGGSHRTTFPRRVARILLVVAVLASCQRRNAIRPGTAASHYGGVALVVSAFQSSAIVGPGVGRKGGGCRNPSAAKHIPSSAAHVRTFPASTTAAFSAPSPTHRERRRRKASGAYSAWRNDRLPVMGDSSLSSFTFTSASTTSLAASKSPFDDFFRLPLLRAEDEEADDSPTATTKTASSDAKGTQKDNIDAEEDDEGSPFWAWVDGLKVAVFSNYTHNPLTDAIFAPSPTSNPDATSAEDRSYRRQLMISERDLSKDNFGPLLPLAEKVDELTGGWGLSYADLHPENETTPAGILFLATNLGYALAGLVLTTRGDIVLGTLTELAGAVSLWYHFSQLKYGVDRAEVRLALLTDYIFAGAALLTGTVYVVTLGVTQVPLACIGLGAAAILCLTLCWVWEFGFPYLFWHSMWHILSALTGYYVGHAHLESLSGGIMM